MSREEAAAKALGVAANKGINPFLRPNQLAALGVRSLDAHNAGVKAMTVSLEAADAHDRANGIQRLTLSDATVERAAKFLPHDQYCGGIYPCDCWPGRMNTARAMLAAAVKEEQA